VLALAYRVLRVAEIDERSIRLPPVSAASVGLNRRSNRARG
jgi:hypothetical protein